MSRIGKKPIAVPKGVTVKVPADAVEVQGPKGKLRSASRRASSSSSPTGSCWRRRSRDDPRSASSRPGAEPGGQRGDRRDRGLQAELDIVGVGYRAEVKGKQVMFALGYSHPVVFDIPAGIDVAIDKQTHITVTGVDRQLVGQVAANIRRLRKPDPYKQKGVRYTGEVLKKKVGKTGAK